MKRFLPFILIFTIALQFFAPFTIGVSGGKLEKKNNTAVAVGEEATNEPVPEGNYSADIKITPLVTNKTITLELLLDQKSKIISEYSGVVNGSLRLYFEVSAYDPDNKKVDSKRSDDLSLINTKQPQNLKLKGFDPLVEYRVVVDLYKRVDTMTSNSTYGGSSGSRGEPTKVATVERKIKTTNSSDETVQSSTNIESSGVGVGVDKSFLPTCGFSSVGGCVARVFYYLFFLPTSFLFGLAGTAMDFTLMYSLSDSSYRTPFVSEGWKVARDLCNMFFIFILLYIAFTTILDFGGSKNKTTVINVVIIGLVLNFSLFATHLIIDASNILARVFYNPNVIVIGTKDENGKIQGEVDKNFKHIRLSEAIVSKVNPQELISQQSFAEESLQNKSSVTQEEDSGISAGAFILITVMATIVNVVGMFAFLSIMLAFVGRVIGLWIAMVLSPLAFLTFTIPQLKNSNYIGWDKWWPETLRTAFMAPVFVFFMYIIVMFLESKMGLNMLKDSNLSGVNKIISIIVPFVIIMVLIKQAKKVALDMAGEVSGMVTKALGKAGGFALGGAMGLGAFAMKSTLGRIGSSVANSETLKAAEAKGGISGWGARQLRNVGSYTGKSSFDVRTTGAGKALDKGLGISTGKGNKDGYIAKQEKILKKATERATTLGMAPTRAAKQDKEAKDWKEKYEKEYYETRLAWEKDPANKGKSFDADDEGKKKFEEEFKAQNGEKIKTSDEIYKERVTDYKESKANTFGADAHTMAKIEKDLKEKGKKEEKKVSAYDKYKASRKKDMANDAIEKTKANIERIDQELEKEVVDVLNAMNSNLNLTLENVTRDHIKDVVSGIQEDIDRQEIEIAKQLEALKTNPSDSVARAALMSAHKEKRKLEGKTNSLNSALSNKQKAEEKMSQQINTLREQDDIINGKQNA